MKAIDIKGVSKKYKEVTAVDNLWLEIEEGELFSLLGVNGAGKTTLIKILSCLTAPTSGEAFVFGHSVAEGSEELKRIIAVSPQETAIAQGLSVKENLELMCTVFGICGEARERKIEELVESFRLGGVLSRKAGKLSGGWQRRLSIAMALVNEPAVMFLDEPTLGLDVIARGALWDIIRALKGRVTIILTTHYMEEAEALSDRIGIMKDGRLLTKGTAGELMKMTNTDRFESAFIAIVRGESV